MTDADVKANQTEEMTLTQRSAFALGVVPLAISLGGSSDVVVSWPPNPDGSDRFSDEAGNVLDYDVDVAATGLIGKGTVTVLSQTASTVTVRITATVLIALGAQFLLYGHTSYC